ncbi:MAG TPA: hypothetical protein VFH88_01780 [Candidatus Krumholzibacteria bacterium]|nr:hypothetical protein [Candidatus Krumholzibacteria bacterium]
MSRMFTIRQGVFVLATAALLSGAGAAHAEGWVFSIIPYAWATDVGVDVTVNDTKIVDKDIPVSDLLKDLNFIFQGRLEAQKGEFGATTDVFDVDLSDDKYGVLLPQGAGTADFSSDMGMTIIDVEGFYDRGGDRQGLVLLAGARILDERSTIDATVHPAMGASFTKTYETDDWIVDALIGARFGHRFTRHWGVQMQADASTGQTDYTFSLSPTVGYAFGTKSRFGVNAGYRYMKVDFEDTGNVNPQMSLSGAVVGFRLSF